MRGGARVLSDATIGFASGSITAICGPNGVGKSSLLMTLAGLLKPESGSVFLGDEALLNVSPRERAKRLGYLPQGSDIAWDVATEKLIALGRQPHRDAGAPRGREAIERAIAATSLQPFRTRPASRLSGGERARALLARVLAAEPDWILADEPLAALDIAHQLALLDHFKASAAQGAGIVMVLHDLALAMNAADRVVVIGDHAGENARGSSVASQGPPGEVLTSELIENVWRVRATWSGDTGRRALHFP